MKREELDDDTRTHLDELLLGLEADLNRNKSPHLTAASLGWMEDGSNVVSGGTVRAPDRPPFNIQSKVLVTRFRSALQAGEKALYGILVRASRPDTDSEWHIDPILIGRVERRALVASRKSIDERVEAKLRQIGEGVAFEWVSFGRPSANKSETRVSIQSSAGHVQRDPEPELVALLAETDALYREAGFQLLTGDWSLRPEGLTFTEYFE